MPSAPPCRPLPHAVCSPMPSAPPYRADPSTAHAARPPTSGGGGGGDGDDFGAWATNAPPPPAPARTPCHPLPPPIRPLDRTRHPSTYKWRWWWQRRRRLRCVGDKRASTICTREDDPMPSAPPTDPTPRLHTPPVHLQVAVVVAATATTSVHGRQTRLHHSGPQTDALRASFLARTGAQMLTGPVVRTPRSSNPPSFTRLQDRIPQIPPPPPILKTFKTTCKPITCN
jgi:hypothetical protein